jgi:hypothetical protein
MSPLAETEPNPRRVGRKILVWAGVVAALTAGCYRPNVVPGGLKCSLPDHECPDGFTCRGDSCVSESAAAGGSTGGANPGGGSTGAGGTGGAGGMGGGAETCATPIEPLCAPPASSSGCDPACQTGCGCGLRCSLTTSGTACATPVGSKGVGQLCQVGVGADDCAPGFVCLREACGSDLGRCYRFCRDSSMCPASNACARVVTLPNGASSGQRVCDMTDQGCDLYAAAPCPDPALRCYVTGLTHTACDCPNADKAEGEACSQYTDCQKGLACLKVGSSPSQCLRLCRSTADCPTCLALSAVVSYCAP